MNNRIFFAITLVVIIAIAVSLSGYAAWNAANPEKTCASCHEINPSLEMWQISSHRDINCKECHGTAMSNGFHSIKEKTGMVFTHIREKKLNSDIRLTETQVIETMDRCANCHQEEQKKWKSGGHAAAYADIFLNKAHNNMERPYWDCFRCHGMHYEGNIYDLIEPVSTRGPWQIIDEGKENDPVMTCMSCHEIHAGNDTRKAASSLEDPKAIFYERKEANANRNPKAGLYIRADEMYLRADHLPVPEMYDGERKLKITPNPLQSVCVQCHSPNWQHQAGTEDDRTPSGVHEGLACMACHETHSNDATNSCTKCHPVISNCGLDHETMNTSYFDPESPNNIHHVKCTDCHDEEDLLRNNN
ncbi:MAG: cytochrome c3 family protein [Bacteroidales bacterium]|nr:cytochrome c3 family protein [Bacteroidales bacterium]